MKKLLVVGGAGYIGAHMVRCLRKAGFSVVVLDNLVSGRREAVGDAVFFEGDCGDGALLATLFHKYRFDGVLHFASHIQVGESVSDPAKYYDNNLARTLTLLNTMVNYKVRHFVFSSTAAVFGNPEILPIDEQHPQHPINPYGRTKWMVEQLLTDYATAYGFRYGCLRYFNAAGADDSGEIGECHDPETHLIPLVLQVASGKRPHIIVFGDDYDTKDGTCIRDYVHVNDLADAHLKMLEYMWKGGEETAFNLGTGNGYSVMEVIEMARKVTGKEIAVKTEGRRTGDPVSLVADGTRARKLLDWNPKRSDLQTIIRDAWRFESKRS